MESEFIAAIHAKRKVRLEFYSQEDRSVIVRLCAPMDFGPSRRAANQSNRFHLWDYDSDTKSHVLSLLPDQVKAIKVLNQEFNPEEFVSWAPAWFIKRDWGKHS